MADGQTQVIAKVERQSADQGFDPDGDLWAIDARRDETASIFVEHGLSGRLTLQAKVGLTRGHDRFVRYEGRGPVELGLRYAVLKSDQAVASVYLGAAEAGAGRNAGYAAPGQGKADLEARVLAGRSMRIRGREAFVDVQAARLRRTGLANETRVDLGLGVRPVRSWLFLAQAYAGRTDSGTVGSRWLKTEISAIRFFGTWGIQAGWRETLAGREVAKDSGAVLGIWRGF